jgi:protein TonB
MALVDDPTYYTAKQLDVHPQAAQPVRPVYPDGVADAGAEGYVTLKLLIDDAGKVREVSVVDALPPGAFEESALAAFRAARFLPGQRNGRPVKSQILIKVTYELLNRRKDNGAGKE